MSRESTIDIKRPALYRLSLLALLYQTIEGLSLVLSTPSVFSKPLIAGSQAFIVYFCDLRSEKYRHLKINSITANGNPINLATSSCLLNLGPDPRHTWRLEGEEVTSRWISMETKECISGILCRCATKEPIFRWTVELELAHHPLGSGNFASIRFECPTSITTESGSQSVNIDANNIEDTLDVYYLTVTPTLPSSNPENRDTIPTGPAEPFVLRAVGPNAVEPESLLCVGHRGMGAETPGSRRWPENTLAGFLRAAEMNLPMVELDILPLQDSSDFVMYHNFNLIMRECGDNEKRPCGCPRHEIDVFDESGICNKFMPNLIPTFSKLELDNLKWGQHLNTCENPVKEKIDKLREYAPFFSDFLKTVPATLAVDIELKYPAESPYSAFKLINEQVATEQSLGGFGHPSCYFYSINKFADNVIRTLQDFGSGRRVMLSTFNPDLCLALRLKQSNFPVVFISRAGCLNPNISIPQHTLDPRHLDAIAAADWAHLIGLAGVVIRGDPLTVQSGHGEALAKHLADRHLACIPFGKGVSERDFIERAASLGITGICIDDVENNAWGTLE